MSSAARDVLPHPGWIQQALRQYERSLLRYAAAIAGQARAPDVVQDAFLRLCAERAEDVQPHVGAWLFAVCKNRALELCRSERRLTTIEEDDMAADPDTGPGTKLEQKEDLSRVGAAMAALSDRQREALLLKVDGGLSYKEIAQVMALSVGNVGFILHTAIAEIRERLAREEATLPPESRRAT
jgi:RNA polymerase sigma factor (sigma-70 family)